MAAPPCLPPGNSDQPPESGGHSTLSPQRVGYRGGRPAPSGTSLTVATSPIACVGPTRHGTPGHGAVPTEGRQWSQETGRQGPGRLRGGSVVSAARIQFGDLLMPLTILQLVAADSGDRLARASTSRLPVPLEDPELVPRSAPGGPARRHLTAGRIARRVLVPPVVDRVYTRSSHPRLAGPPE